VKLSLTIELNMCRLTRFFIFLWALEVVQVFFASESNRGQVSGSQQMSMLKGSPQSDKIGGGAVVQQQLKEDPEHDGYEVSQVHLAMGKTPSTMTIQWATPGSGSASSNVLLSTNSDGTGALQFSGSSSSYSFPVYETWPAYSSPKIHTVEVTNLNPSTTYYYQCGDVSANQLSGMLSFTTLPAPGDHSGMLSFGVIGDLGMTNDSMATLNHMMMNPLLSMILHAGDLGYSDCRQPLWDRYGIMIEPLANSLPWMVGPGNHEIEFVTGDDGSGLYRSFETRYKMPGDKPAELGKITFQDWFGCCPSAFQSEYNYGNSFYSFETGLAHVIYANSYSTTDTSSEQWKWLVADLASVDRSTTPWVIVVTHSPWYNSNTKHRDEFQAVQMKQNLEQLFYENQVNIVIAGHVHAYERSHPVYKNVTVSDGITYINIGDGGNAEGHDFNYTVPAPLWSAYRNGTQFGHGELKILDSKTAIWDWFRNVDGEYVHQDQLELVNNAAVLSPTAAPPTLSPSRDSTALGLFFPSLSPTGIAVVVSVGLLGVFAAAALVKRWFTMQNARKAVLAMPVPADDKEAVVDSPITLAYNSAGVGAGAGAGTGTGTGSGVSKSSLKEPLLPTF